MAEEVPKSEQPLGHHGSGDLMASAKVLAEAAQSGGKNIDKAKVAGAADDVLEAAKTYGKLDETTGFGQYVGKAEGYLHSYGSSDKSTPAAAAAVEKPHASSEEGEKEKEKEKDVKKSSDGDDGASDVINMAKKGLGGFFS